MRRTRLIIAAAVVVGALIYVIIGGIRGAIVYYITPSELLAQEPEVQGRTVRLGGQVVAGSKQWNPATQELRFQVTDGQATVPVYYKGAPPNLFTEGQGAIVEGAWTAGEMRARSIIVKHSEEYKPPTPAP